MESAVLEFWRDYLDSLPPDLDQPKPAGVFSFGDSKKLADGLAALVRQGIKTAHDAWLSGEAGKEVLIPFPADRMKAWPVSPRVNSPKNNDPEIVAPIEQHEKGSHMEHGEFSFDSGEELNFGERPEF